MSRSDAYSDTRSHGLDVKSYWPTKGRIYSMIKVLTDFLIN